MITQVQAPPRVPTRDHCTRRNDIHVAQLEALAERDQLISDYAVDNLSNII